MNTTILVTGANGQLGLALRQALPPAGPGVLYTDVQDLDITDAPAVERFVRAHAVGLLVNCAAYTAVDQAEEEPEAADRVNHLAAQNLARAAQAHGARLIHISTDYVFDGRHCTPYREDHPTGPIGAYGRSKLLGEIAVQRHCAEHMIIRTSWLYSAHGANFVKTILRKARERGPLRVVADQVGSPTHAADLAQAIALIVAGSRWAPGIYHYANEGVCSWYDLALATVRMAGIECPVLPCRTDEFPTRARRPHYSVLDKGKIKERFGMSIPYWRDSLEQCVRALLGERHSATP